MVFKGAVAAAGAVDEHGKRGEMKYVICGIEHIGVRVVEFLAAQGESVTVVTRESEEVLLEGIRARIDAHVTGDARQQETLRKAGVESADVMMALTSNDVKNLEIHLLAKSINPKLVTIARLSSEGLSREMESGFDIEKTLNTAALAAPNFVSACMDQAVLHTFVYKDALWFIGMTAVDTHSPLLGKRIREIETAYGAQVFLRETAQTRETVDLDKVAAQAGDRLFFITRERKFFEVIAEHARNEVKEMSARGTKPKHRSIVERLTAMPKGLQYVLATYFLLSTLSIILFHFGTGLSVIDSLYFVVTTTTTVGFGDINLKDSPVFYKLYGSFIMIAGAALLAALYSVITEFFVSRRFDQLFGFTRYRLNNHVVVAGLGQIGYGIVQLLHRNGMRVVAIESNPDSRFISLLRGKVPIIVGDAQYPDIQARAGISKARTIVAAVDNDLRNINILLQARKHNEHIRTVARLFNRSIESKVQASFQIDRVLSTSAISAPLFLASAVARGAVSAFSLKDGVHIIAEFEVGECALLKDLTPHQLFERFGISVLAVVDPEHGVVFVPDGHPFTREEVLLLMGSYQDFKKLSLSA